jgi:NAD+ kinase
MTFGIIGNSSKKNLNIVLNSLLSFLKKNNIKFILHDTLKPILNYSKYKNDIKNIKYLLDKSDIIISLGGDGTFLNTARIVGRKEIPILGINLGNLGFMAEVTPKESEKFLKDIIHSKYKIYDLCVISAKAEGKKCFNGINEIVVDKCNSIKMVEIEIYYNNEMVVNFVGDGVIVSTPTGSTGYSLSAGGPIISPYSKVFIITPICPHTLNFRPIIVPDNGTIVIKTLKNEKIRLTADGFTSKIFKSPMEIFVTKADYNIKVVKKLNKTYFQTLNNKLLWGADVRQF